MVIIGWSGVPDGCRAAAPPGAIAGFATKAPGIATPAAADLSCKTILLLHAYSYEIASYLVMDPVFVNRFSAAGLDAGRLHYEFLDLSKHPDPQHRRAVAGYLGRKYGNKRVDLVIALHPAALQFLVEEGRDLFSGTPVLNIIGDPEFSADNDFRTRQIRLLTTLGRTAVIMPFLIDTDATLKSILALLPDVRTLLVIGGSGLLDKRLEQTVRLGLQSWEGRLGIEYVTAWPLNELLRRVAALPPKTAILYTLYSADPAGRTYRSPDVVQRISRTARAPVFGLYDSLLGNRGIVGGIMPSFKGEAERAAGLALEVLRGSLRVETVFFSPAPAAPMFDWEQLKRWRLPEKRLPSGSVVFNRPRTVWSEYRQFVIGILIMTFVLTSLVVGLLIQGRRKARAESSLREKELVLQQNQDQLRKLTGRLISAQEEERRRLARELHDDLTQQLAALAIDTGKMENQLQDSPPTVREKVGSLKRQLVAIAGDINNLARQLHPAIIDDLGLVRAIESECLAFQKREGVAIAFHHEKMPERMDKQIALTLYRIVQEGLRNISKHACAEQVSVSLKATSQEIRLDLQDNGIGFDLAASRSTPGLGLSSLRERVRLAKGAFSIQTRPAEGTSLSARIPLNPLKGDDDE